MKAIRITAISLIASLIVAAENDAFAASPSDLPRPDRIIATMPKSVFYEAAKGHHIYTIKGIYATSPQSGIDEPAELSANYIPDVEACSFDFEKRTATIQTSRRLTNSELAYAIDDIAAFGGDMPYWAELVARDLPESKEYTDLKIEIEEFKGDFPECLAWFSPSSHEPFEMPFTVSPPKHFKVLIVPTTAFCMCHSRYCIRILDPMGKVVWKDSTTAYATVSIAVATSDDGLGHKLLIRRYNHGERANFIVKLKSEQPSTRPESKSEDGAKPHPK
jgi:hypothetical protein